MARKAPNRVLDLEELSEPFFAQTVSELQRLTAKESVSYLHPSKQWEYPWALEQAALSAGTRVLDAGCGASIFPVFLAAKGCRVAACDLEVPAGLAQHHGVDVAYIRGSLTALPYPEGCFAVVFCISVIEHLPLDAIPLAMGELNRVLAPGGRLLLTTDFYQRSDAAIRYRGPGPSFEVDWNVFDRKRLERYILSAPGFRVRGPLDLAVRWEEVRPRMIDFHGYPYTSVGILLERM